MTTDDPVQRVSTLLADHGVHGRRLRIVVALLTSGWQSLAELVRQPAVPRRTVEELLAAMGPDIERDGDRHRIHPWRTTVYREHLELGTELGNALNHTDPLEAAAQAHEEMVTRIKQDIHAVPAPMPALDHVAATAQTMLRRAMWLDEQYTLSGARLLCLGDHDLTSLAVCAVRPDLEVLVVDLDERVLEFIDTRAAERGFNIRCVHADFRFGLPPAAQGWADLVFTDPPYTPEGIGLFVARAASCLRDVDRGRILLAYGFSERNPTLGLKVQQEIMQLGVLFEAILPRFNRYHGAQAVGSASELYVLRATSKTRKLIERPASTAIYTHGPQSVEAQDKTASANLESLRAKASADGKLKVDDVRGPAWDKPINAAEDTALAINATGDPGPWLLRVLLAASAPRVAVLVANNHLDLSNQVGQRALTAALRHKYRLRFLRSTPDDRSAVVVAEQIPASRLDAGERLARHILDRAHGKVGNLWREGLISTAKATGITLTRNAARDLVAEAAPNPTDLNLRLIDIPRHRIAPLLDAITASAADLS
ncbi:bis-aminopropyl spermidine synthase family protein [Allokutzneria multivorans]|uniref:Bis-aminopropyl spermidine synthase family protein n=1 Tax=Allokutzneria multivorans TaxID=1142134 RepID=A0ABP7SRB6_9PSEU